MDKIKGTEGQTIQWTNILSIVLSVLPSLLFCPLYCLSFRPFYFVHCIVCPSVPFILSIVLSILPTLLFCPLYCLSFRPFSFVHCIVCPSVPFIKGRKDKQNNGQNKRDGRTNNTKDKRKGTEGQTIQWTK
jgi:hypothetical protein